jgi:hypothetical protein
MKKEYLTQRLEAIHAMPNYLRVLSTLTDKSILRDDLISLADTISLLDKMKDLRSQASQKIEIEFAQKKSKDFSKFIHALTVSKEMPVYVWSEGASVCGLFKTHSLQDINFNFEYGIDGNGVFSFISSDLKDELLLDFYETSDGKRMIKIEVFGNTWAKVKF